MQKTKVLHDRIDLSVTERIRDVRVHCMQRTANLWHKIHQGIMVCYFIGFRCIWQLDYKAALNFL